MPSLEELKDSAIAAANRLAGDGLDRKTLATLCTEMCTRLSMSQLGSIQCYNSVALLEITIANRIRKH